jgi:hypothetical protein
MAASVAMVFPCEVFMLSQLVVIDFTGGNRTFQFQELTKSHESAMSYYMDRLYDDYAAYLFNYERYHSTKPKLQLVFLFQDDSDTCRDRAKTLITDINLRFELELNAFLSVVEHGDRVTICEYTPREEDRSIRMTLDWLTGPIPVIAEETQSKGDDP